MEDSITVDNIIAMTASRMEKQQTVLDEVFKTIRAGRAHPDLLEKITVDYYGTYVPISQVASIHVESTLVLIVTPWEKSMQDKIVKAIVQADIGSYPVPVEESIRVPFQSLTEEVRQSLVKRARQETERVRVSVRDIRRSMNAACKKFLKEKEIGKDEEQQLQEAIQDLTDKKIRVLNAMLAEKEKALI